MKKAVAVFAVFMIALVNSAYSQEVVSYKEGWHKIGETEADFKTEKESISVLGADKFKSIKLKVTNASINIESVQVFYESGEMEEVPVKSERKEGTKTRVIDIDLKGGATKELNKVVFNYKTVPNSKNNKAHVELFGLK